MFAGRNYWGIKNYFWNDRLGKATVWRLYASCSHGERDVKDVFWESDSENRGDKSSGEMNSLDMTDDIVTDLTLNMDDPEGLLALPNVDIDLGDLSENKPRIGRGR